MSPDRTAVTPNNRLQRTALRAAADAERCDEISDADFVPQKVTELVAESGALGDDARHYQVRAVKRAVEESKS